MAMTANRTSALLQNIFANQKLNKSRAPLSFMD